MAYLNPGEPQKRLKLFVGIVTVIALLFVGRLFYTQVIDAERLNTISSDQRSVPRTLPAIRGTIYDAEGKVLAKTVMRYDINVAPSKVAEFTRTVNDQDVQVTVDQAAGEMASALSMTKAAVLKKITGTGEYAQVKKRVDAAAYRQIKDLNIPWVYTDAIADRLYPNGAVAGNIVGFVNAEGIGVAGIEQMYDKCLAGVSGQETFETGADGIKIPESTVTITEAVPGRDVHLTINADLQYYAQQVMASTVSYLRGDWGSATIIDIKTGRILAAAEAPTVDPNAPEKSKSEDRGARIFQQAFEPGSTLKTITAAIAIEEGKATPETKVTVPYSWPLPGVNYNITDSHVHPTEQLTTTGILRDSSNTGIAQIGGLVDYKIRRAYLDKFGLGSKTSIGFPGEHSGLLNTLENWDGIKRWVSTFGQGVSVTPIQSAMMYQALGNGGVLLEPTLTDGCADENGKYSTAPVKAGKQVVSAATAESTLLMLEKVVEHGGIGHYRAVPGYRIRAQTGTAQITDPATGRYGSLHAVSYIGLGPIEDAQFVVAVTVYKSRTISNSFGVAGPFKKIMQQTLRTYRVPPSTTKSPNIAEEW